MDIPTLDVVIVAVMHKEYRDLGLEKLAALCNDGDPLVIDVKSAFDPEEVRKAGINYWRL